jgi:hypothetical protein
MPAGLRSVTVRIPDGRMRPRTRALPDGPKPSDVLVSYLVPEDDRPKFGDWVVLPPLGVAPVLHDVILRLLHVGEIVSIEAPAHPHATRHYLGRMDAQTTIDRVLYGNAREALYTSHKGQE